MLSYKPLWLAATTCLIAVKYDWGLKNLETIITLGKFNGSSLKKFNCSTLWSKFIIQPYKPLLLG